MTNQVIDPTVPLCGLPLEAVESAVWGEWKENIFRGTEIIEKVKRVPVINGISLHTFTPEKEYTKYIMMFPKVRVFVPETEQERRDFQLNKERAVLIVTINGCSFTVPKGVSVEVPEPINEVIQNSMNPIRTPDMMANAGRTEFNPLEVQ